MVELVAHVQNCLRNGVPVVWKRGKANTLQVGKEKRQKKSVGQALY